VLLVGWIEEQQKVSKNILLSSWTLLMRNDNKMGPSLKSCTLLYGSATLDVMFG
jgi:hypothetical protein